MHKTGYLCNKCPAACLCEDEDGAEPNFQPFELFHLLLFFTVITYKSSPTHTHFTSKI